MLVTKSIAASFSFVLEIGFHKPVFEKPPEACLIFRQEISITGAHVANWAQTG